MPSFTPNLNLYKPGGGSTGLITPDEVVDIDRINANMDLVDTFAGQSIARDKKTSLAVADAAERDAWLTGATQGDRVFQRDLGLEMVYGANGWQPAVGLVPLRPSTVVNATIGTDGAIVPQTTAATSIAANGLFSTKFRQYRIEYHLHSSVAIIPTFQYRNGSTVFSSYVARSIEGLGSGSVITFSATTTNMDLGAGTNVHNWGELTLFNPALNAAGQVKPYIFQGAQAEVTTVFRSGHVGAGADTITFDGFQLNFASTGFLLPQSFIRVYGMA